MTEPVYEMVATACPLPKTTLNQLIYPLAAQNPGIRDRSSLKLEYLDQSRTSFTVESASNRCVVARIQAQNEHGFLC